jgi:hypothetical protein
VALEHTLLKTVHAVLSAKMPYREDPPIRQDLNVKSAQHHAQRSSDTTRLPSSKSHNS